MEWLKHWLKWLYVLERGKQLWERHGENKWNQHLWQSLDAPISPSSSRVPFTKHRYLLDPSGSKFQATILWNWVQRNNFGNIKGRDYQSCCSTEQQKANARKITRRISHWAHSWAVFINHRSFQLSFDTVEDPTMRILYLMWSRWIIMKSWRTSRSSRTWIPSTKIVEFILATHGSCRLSWSSN